MITTMMIEDDTMIIVVNEEAFKLSPEQVHGLMDFLAGAIVAVALLPGLAAREADRQRLAVRALPFGLIAAACAWVLRRIHWI